MKRRKLFTMLLSLMLLLSVMVVPVSASSTSNDAIKEARKGILQVAVMITVDNEDVGYVHLGTGFLIGGEDGAQTVITNHHVIHALSEEDARAMVGAPENARITLTPRIVVKRDVLISASVVNESMQADFAILRLEQPIYDRAPLVLGDSDAVETTDTVFALGFPGIISDIQTDQVYTSDDVTVTQGIVSKTNEVQIVDVAIPCITHSAVLAPGNSGGPLVTAEGYVIGVNTLESNDTEGNSDYYFSTKISEVRDVLDALGIEYISSTERSEPDSEETQAPAETEAPAETQAPVVEETENPLFDELKDEINAANLVSLDGMTEDSVDNFKQALNAAEATYRNADATTEELEDAIDELKVAKDGLVEETGMSTTTIIIIVAAVLVVVIIVVVIIVVSSSKKKAAAAQAPQRGPVRPNGPQPGMPPMGGPQPGGWNPQQPQQPMGGPQGYPQQPPRQPQPQQPMGGPQGYPQQPPYGGPAPYNAGNDGSAETSVLGNDGAGETTLLGGGAGLPPAYLVRKNTNERVTISKQVFKLGKERRRVDYCIADNTNISRAHADIVFKNGEFYIVDNNATNGTFVNGSTVAGGQERKLNNGDVIKLADEEFRFQL